MDCACFDADVDDYVTPISDTKPTARKEHTCCECGRIIRIGERYRLEKNVFDGSFDTFKTCVDCDSVRTHLVCSFYYTQVWELVTENIRECALFDSIPYSKIAKLTPLAREQVCEIIEEYWDDQEDEY